MKLNKILAAGAAVAGAGALAALAAIKKSGPRPDLFENEPAAEKTPEWDTYRMRGGQLFAVRQCGQGDIDWLVPFASGSMGEDRDVHVKEGLAAAASTCLARGTCWAAFLNGQPAAFAGAVPCRPLPPEAEYLLDPGSLLAGGTNRGHDLKKPLYDILPDYELAYVPCLYLRPGFMTEDYAGLGAFLLRRLAKAIGDRRAVGLSVSEITRAMYVQAGFLLDWEQDGAALYFDA